jgi:hypothetical protein
MGLEVHRLKAGDQPLQVRPVRRLAEVKNPAYGASITVDGYGDQGSSRSDPVSALGS